MNEATREAVREVADHGIWTLGIVAALAVGAISVRDVGPLGVLVPVAMIALLGVTGYFAVESIDNIARTGK